MRNLLLVLCALSVPTQAAEVVLEWNWPVVYCDGTSIDLAHIEQAEIYIDTIPIPANADSCTDPLDVPPASAILETVTTPETSVALDLAPGIYYIRMRVQVNGKWSSLSGQTEKEVEFARPNVPIIIRIG